VNIRVWDGYFRVSDPLPGIYYYAIHVFARKLAKRLRPVNAIALAKKRFQ
jgi:hypothetical protein